MTSDATSGCADTEHMLSKAAFTVIVLAALPLLSACGTDASGTDADCIARIRYEGVIYRPHDELNQAAPQGGELGKGDVVDCGEADSAPKVDEVTVFSVKGVAPSIALKVEQGSWRGIYVAEDVLRSAWPPILRSP